MEELMKRKNRRLAPAEGKLLKRVRELLETTSVPGLDIFQATGVAPNQQWAIKSGKTTDPSVNTVEALFEFLRGKPLEL